MASELREPASLGALPVAQASRRGAEIVVRGLDKAFGPRHVLHGVDLSLAPGEFMTILGPSGGGKTTLLRLVAGLDKPSSGTIELRSPDGRPATVRMMFQEDRLLPWRRVLANVGLGLPVQGARRARPRRPGVRRSGGSGHATGRRCFRVDNGSASPWRERSCIARTCCCWTSPSARWTR